MYNKHLLYIKSPRTYVRRRRTPCVSDDYTVTEIGGVAFGQTSIQTINLPAELKKLGSAAFNGSSLVSVQIPEGVKVCNNLFLQCYYLKNVEFLGELESIEAHCFANCNSLESVTMKGVKECFPKAFLYSSETERIYCGSDVYYSPDSFIKAVSSNPGNGYTRGDMVDVGGIMLTPKAYEAAVLFNDSLNAAVEDYKRNFDIDETEIQQLKLSRIFRKSSCDYGYGTMSGSANGTLLYGVAVCEGMAECMKVLCELADIECVVIREVPLDHAWVKVKVDGEWYNCDPTWGEYLYTDDKMSESCIRVTDKPWNYSAYPDILSPDHRLFLSCRRESQATRQQAPKSRASFV